jgi:hypothetical protein
MQSKAKAAWMERWKLLSCLARLKEPQVLSCGILGGTLSLLGLRLPFTNQWTSERGQRKEGKERNMEEGEGS